MISLNLQSYIYNAMQQQTLNFNFFNNSLDFTVLSDSFTPETFGLIATSLQNSFSGYPLSFIAFLLAPELILSSAVLLLLWQVSRGTRVSKVIMAVQLQKIFSYSLFLALLILIVHWFNMFFHSNFDLVTQFTLFNAVNWNLGLHLCQETFQINLFTQLIKIFLTLSLIVLFS